MVMQVSPAQELARRYAPIVYTKDQEEPCDGNGEAFAPVAVELVLGNPDVVLRNDPNDSGIAGPMPRDLFGKPNDFYLDFPSSPKEPGCDYETYYDGVASGVPNVAYAHVVTEPGKRGVALQYWFYYYFNDWNNNHESDWEMIQIFFDVASVDEALTVAPEHVGYSQHAGGERAGWNDDKLHREGDRPVVYVAAGSHSNQYEQKNYLGRAEEGAGFGCDDATGPSTRIDLEPRLVPDAVDSADDEYAWLTYEGRWGERLSGEFNGPTGPNAKTQWSKPVTWSESKLRDANVPVPGGKTAGISPTNAFCGVVAFVSQRLLSVIAASPWILPVAALALGGSVFVTVRNTDFGIAREPLRRSRRFGQILRTSLAIYRANFWLMVGIALTFVPAGFLAAGLQSLLFRFSPLERLLDVARTPRVVDAVLGLVVGSAVFGIAYVIVVVGVIAAVREIEAGRPVSPLRAYRVAWDHAGDLVRARLRATLILIGLAISIVGIPRAIRRGVDWLFIEQAILLDNATKESAADASADAVRGDWLRTFAIQCVLLGLGALTSLIVVTPIMLFATQVPLDTVNAISSLLYILIAPFVGLSLTLLYLDVRARNVQQDELHTASTGSR
jgi:hypothetical protein